MKNYVGSTVCTGSQIEPVQPELVELTNIIVNIINEISMNSYGIKCSLERLHGNRDDGDDKEDIRNPIASHTDNLREIIYLLEKEKYRINKLNVGFSKLI